MKKILIILLLLISNSTFLFSQSANIPLNRDYYHLIDRYEIMNGKFSDNIHSHVKPLQRHQVAGFIDSLYQNEFFLGGLSARDVFNLQYLANDNWEWSQNDESDSNKPLFKYIYRKKSDFLNVDEGDFDLHVNPVIYFSGGKESASDVATYINTKGVDLRGSISKRLGFYSFISSTQAVFPNYIREWTAQNGVVPGEGFWKKFQENGFDYFTARGYISFELVKKYVVAEFGFDQSFTGAGHRSMILSDFSPGYTYLKFNTKIWKINYSNLFAQTIANANYADVGSLFSKFPKKFMASHHLSLNITNKLNVGFFESVVIGDSTEGFDISYLNPIIFYRALEHQGGSTYNAIVGFDAKWNIGRALSLYGQLVLDEFAITEITSGDGWWGNKIGGQIGLKYINAIGINNLDLQLEYNVARPYIFAHMDTYTNYAHYRQPLGHPLGGNFREVLGILRYQPINKLFITAQLNYAKYGDDTQETNWGKNVMLSYNTREKDYGNEIGQGIATNLLYGDLTLSYMLKHNLFIDIRGIYRELGSEIDARDSKTSYFSGCMRWNIGRKLHDF